MSWGVLHLASLLAETHEVGVGSVVASTGSCLWLALPCVPLVAAVLLPLLRSWVKQAKPGVPEGLWATAVCTSVAAALAGMWSGGVAQGTVDLPGVVGWGISLTISPVGLLFALFATGLWAVAASFSLSYLAGGHGHARYYFYFLLSLSGTIGVFLAGNLFTLFVFFELVSLGSYPLVVHEENEEAMSAGRLYLFMGIAGGLILLLGAMWLQALQGSPVAIGVPLAVTRPLWPWAVSMVLLVLGFGVKAGMYPVHVWLPRAHPVAPSPASALLSGVMIKTGAYGIYQVVRMFSAAGGPAPEHAAESPAPVLFALAGHEAPAAVQSVAGVPDLGKALGIALVVVALLTMFLGALLALVQTNAKRLLAYSSVSQMGYILMGAGMAGVLGSDEALAAAGFALHVLNHALFKSTLFMLVGVVYLRTHQLDLRRLGRLGRRMPVTALVFAMAVMAIAGVPGLNGYASKTLLHDAILVLNHDHPGQAWRLVELLFTLGGALTFAYAVKLWYFLFWRRAGSGQDGHEDSHEDGRPAGETTMERIMAVGLALPMLFIGLRPAAVVSGLVTPFALASGFSHAALHHVESVLFFSEEALLGALASLGLGVLVFAALYVLGFPHPEIRRGPSVEGWVFLPLVRLGALFCVEVAALDRSIDSLFLWLGDAGRVLVVWITWLEAAAERSALRFGIAVCRIWVTADDSWYAVFRRIWAMTTRGTARAAELLPILDDAPGETDTAREFNLLNLDFDFFVVLTVITAALVLVFAVTRT